MYATTVNEDVLSIVAGAMNSPRLKAVDPTAILGKSGVKVERFLAKVGIHGDYTLDAGQCTLVDLVDFLEAQSDSVRANLWRLATEARIRRLLQGILLARGQRVPDVDERQLKWHELVSQILWWSARQTEQGVELVRRGAPIKALQTLTALGGLGLEAFAKGSDVTAKETVHLLQRCGFPEKAAQDAYIGMEFIATKIAEEYDGRIQEALRPHVEKLADTVTKEILAGIDAPTFLSDAVRMWVGTTTRFPVARWSPSTTDFIKKFDELEIGVNNALLASIVDVVGYATVDSCLTDFMDGICRTCDPNNKEHQYCVKRFGPNWEVECLAHPEW